MEIHQVSLILILIYLALDLKVMFSDLERLERSMRFALWNLEIKLGNNKSGAVFDYD